MRIRIPSRGKVVCLLVKRYDCDRQLLPIALCLLIVLIPLLCGAGLFAYKVVYFQHVFKISPFDPYAKQVVVSNEVRACSFADFWKEKSDWMDRGPYRNSDANRANHELYRSFSEHCSEMGELGVDFGMLNRIGPGEYRVKLEF